jgi:hypothetical protein
MEGAMQKMSPMDAADDVEYYRQDIVEFVQMLQRRLRDTKSMRMSSRELDKGLAYQQLSRPWQDHLRAVLSAGRRAGWRPPND